MRMAIFVLKRGTEEIADKPIVRIGNDTWQNSRRGVWVCPFCGYDPGIDDWKVWEENATKLVLEPKIWKYRHVVVFSECPKCFEESWLHYKASMIAIKDMYIEFPDEWRTAIKKLMRTRKWKEEHG